MTPEFWKDKKVLLTGHTGFKGSWLSIWLKHLGADVVGLSLDPPSEINLFDLANVADDMTSILGDIRELGTVINVVEKARPEIVLHLAAQSLVRCSYDNPVETYATNVMGTLHVLEAMRQVGSVRAAVLVTTDKCYENKEWIWAYRENERMGGKDMYSSSKGCSELLISSYRSSFLESDAASNNVISIASARAGNVIGGGDWAADRLVPDILQAFEERRPVRIRNPAAIRPWQHVMEPLMGYLELAEQLYRHGKEFSEGWNFGPSEEDARPVEWIVKQMASRWSGDAEWEIDEGEHPREANYLKLDSSKARNFLGWKPRWDLRKALDKVVDWHIAYRSGEDLNAMTVKQVEEYLNGG